jgi:hypothetical protein
MAPGIIQGRQEPAQGALLDSVKSASATATARATPRALDAVTNVDRFVVADFPGDGVWLYSSVNGWRQLSPMDAVTVAVDDSGDVVGNFAGVNGIGIARWVAAYGKWELLTHTAASCLAEDANGDVVANILGYGVARWEVSTGWQSLTSAQATSVSIAATASWPPSSPTPASGATRTPPAGSSWPATPRWWPWTTTATWSATSRHPACGCTSKGAVGRS